MKPSLLVRIQTKTNLKKTFLQEMFFHGKNLVSSVETLLHDIYITFIKSESQDHYFYSNLFKCGSSPFQTVRGTKL